MEEFNLLRDYPRAKRNNSGRVITPEAIRKAEELGFDYFDGKREYGFGGYVYDGRWQSVAKLARARYRLNKSSRVLVSRCDKGFLVYDLKKEIPGITVYGLYDSSYPINHAMDGFGRWALINEIKNGDKNTIEEEARQEVLPFLIQGDARDLPFKDRYFDTVISINSVCAYPKQEARRAIREIIRVSSDNGRESYIQNDSWRNEQEEKNLRHWSLLCRTFLDTEGWKKIYEEEGYDGDYNWTIIE